MAALVKKLSAFYTLFLYLVTRLNPTKVTLFRRYRLYISHTNLNQLQYSYIYQDGFFQCHRPWLPCSRRGMLCMHDCCRRTTSSHQLRIPNRQLYLRACQSSAHQELHRLLRKCQYRKAIIWSSYKGQLMLTIAAADQFLSPRLRRRETSASGPNVLKPRAIQSRTGSTSRNQLPAA